ncbi:MAG: alpha/beta hydrolase [Candidatus Binatus sp.]
MLTENERKVLADWNVFVKNVPPSIEGLRTNYEKWSEEQNKDLPQIGSYEEAVTLRPGLTADVAVPKDRGPHPVLLYLHGGGWVAGSARTHKKVAAELAARGYLTFNLDYRLAPEHQFPAGIDDCVFAANWISENAKRWNGDPKRMAVGGDSAGGNLAAATAIVVNGKSGGPKFKAAVLIYGVFDMAATIERSKQTGAGLTEGAAQGYLGKNYPAALNDPRVSPSRGLAKGAIPPSFIICGTADDLLPESRAMSEAMNKAGIEHELHVVDEMPHAFMQMGALSDCRKGFSLISTFLARHV